MIRNRSKKLPLEEFKALRYRDGSTTSRFLARASSVASTSRLSPCPPAQVSALPGRSYSTSSSLCQAAVRESRSDLSEGAHTEFSDITIVGGGVVGLALASSLASDPSFQSSGATMTLIEGASLEKARSWADAKEKSKQESTTRTWENRVIYLTEENRRWLDKIGVTPYLASSQLGPVHSMVVTDGVSGASLNFDAPNPAHNRMGTMVEISNLQQAMLRNIEDLKAIKGVNVDVVDSSRVESIEADGENADGDSGGLSPHVDSWPLLRHSASKALLKSRLLVGADGHNSPVRNYAGIKATGWEYGRMGVVATMRTVSSGLSERTAFQRFLPTGTIAFLPLADDCASLVWTLPPDMAKAINVMQKDTEAAASQGTSPLGSLVTAAFRLPWSNVERILDKLVVNHKADHHDYAWIVPTIEEHLITAADGALEGSVPPTISSIDQKSVAAFPLKLSHAECYLGSSLLKTTFAESGAGAIQPSAILGRIISAATGTRDQDNRPVRGRTALIGDAAHTIHPLAGQGLNLGLADARSLSASLIRAVQVGGDLGSHLTLSSYPKDRYLANQAMLSAVDHLHWLFALPPPGDPRNGILGNVWSQAVVWGRSNGFEILNELTGVKRALMGFAGSEKK
ncbi:hypothetical protein CBS101457_002708 [Exobasidium rhododendri]|nr:hypothetical protein CBS101457_002708 [Exobasidium rhododendri]